MKYLVRNSLNVIDMMFEQPVSPSMGLDVIPVPDQQFKQKMLGSIFIDVNRYKPDPNVPGKNYWVSDGTDWVDGRTEDEVWEDVRSARNTELFDSDWTQLDDSPLTPPEKGLWTAYRQQMRNIPNNNANPRTAETALEAAIANDKPQVGRNRDT